MGARHLKMHNSRQHNLSNIRAETFLPLAPDTECRHQKKQCMFEIQSWFDKIQPNIYRIRRNVVEEGLAH